MLAPRLAMPQCLVFRERLRLQRHQGACLSWRLWPRRHCVRCLAQSAAWSVCFSLVFCVLFAFVLGLSWFAFPSATFLLARWCGQRTTCEYVRKPSLQQAWRASAITASKPRVWWREFTPVRSSFILDGSFSVNPGPSAWGRYPEIRRSKWI